VVSYLPNFTLLSSYGYSKNHLETGDETPTAKVAPKHIFFVHFPQLTSFQSFTIKPTPTSYRRGSAVTQFGLDLFLQTLSQPYFRCFSIRLKFVNFCCNLLPVFATPYCFIVAAKKKSVSSMNGYIYEEEAKEKLCAFVFSG
jgi:hypothetical protein